MASITFNPKAGAPVVAPTDETPVSVTLEVAAPQNQAITVVSPSSNGPGNVDQSDIILPRVNLVQKTSELCNIFAPGSFIFEKEVVLTKTGEPLTATVLDIGKYFQEKIEYGSGEFGRRASSEDEVEALGGTTTYGIADKPYFASAANILMAVKAPEGLAEDVLLQFPFPYMDENYAMAVYTVSSSSYTTLAKRIFTDKAFILKAGLHLGEYSIKSELKRNGANSWYVPVAGMPKKHIDPKKVEFFASLANL